MGAVHVVELENQLASMVIMQSQLLLDIEVRLAISVDDSEVTRFEDL